MGYLPLESSTASAMVADAENRLLASIASHPDHVLRPLFPLIITRRPGLRRRPCTRLLPAHKGRQQLHPAYSIPNPPTSPLMLFFALFDDFQFNHNRCNILVIYYYFLCIFSTNICFVVELRFVDQHAYIIIKCICTQC